MKVLKYFLCFLCFGLISITNFAQVIPQKTLYDINNTEYQPQELNEGKVIFLIASLTCGYCLNEISFYNQLSEKNSHKIKFIVLLENKAEYVKEYKEKNNVFFNEDWIIIPSSMRTIRKIWKKKVFPEYHIYSQGNLIKSFAYSNEDTRESVYYFLEEIE